MKLSELPNKSTIWCCIIISIVWSLFGMMLPPNLPFILRSYKEHLDDAGVSMYNSWLVSLFFMGQIIGNLFWGWLADRIGRKLSMILTMSFNVVCIIAFGLCDSVYPALAIRFIHGILDGVIPVCKTIQTEIASPETIGFISSLFFVGSSIGGLIGPSLGGYLSKVENIKGIIRVFPIFKRFPYLFPFLIVCILFVCAIIIVWIFCIETLPKEKRVNKKSHLRFSSSSMLLAMETELLPPSDAPTIPWYKLFKGADAILVLLLYTLSSLVTFGFITILSVAITNKVEYDGLEIEREEASLVTSITNVFQFFIVFFMPLLGELFLYKNIMGVAVFITGIFPLLYPLLPLTLPYGKTVLYSLFLPYNIVNAFANSLVMKCDFIDSLILSAAMVLFANIAYDEYRGLVMGLSETVACITRCLSPIAFSYLYGWTLEKEPSFWVNPHMTFIILGIIGVLSSLLAFWISPKTNHGKGSVRDSIVLRKE